MIYARLARLALDAATRFRSGGVVVNAHVLTAAQVREQVDALGRVFDFVSHDEMLQLRTGRRPFCLLTFDDGKRNNAVETAPELLRLGVPAVFYLTTRYIGHDAPLWFDRHRALRKVVRPLPAGLNRAALKAMPLAATEARVDAACRAHGVDCDPHADSVAAMSWGDARRLAADGFTLGAHSLRHAVLTRETEADASADIRESIAEVTREVGQCPSFAFPNGNYTRRLAQIAFEAGVDTVVTTEPTWMTTSVPLWRIPRVQLDAGSSGDRVALKVAAAAIPGVLVNPDGTGRAYRTVHRHTTQSS